MRRALIVVSSYAPTMIADMHRARQLAWELPKYGWEVEILAPDQSFQPDFCIENDSAAFFPTSTKVYFATPLLQGMFRRLGMRTIGWRAFVPMWRAGSQIIREDIDLVYFSTTQFCLFLLGPIWRALFGVPYVLDFHDPCVKQDKKQPVWIKRSWRHVANRLLLIVIEALATRRASALVSVSPNYLELLSERHSSARRDWTKAHRTIVAPFAVLERDLIEAKATVQASAVSTERLARIVYVGAGGPIMKRSFSLLCASLAALRIESPELVAAVRFDLYGTQFGWREGDPHYLGGIAQEHGIGELVTEFPGRVSYRRSLEVLLEGSGAIVLGVDDPGYMPSKLFPYAYSGLPLLACLRRDGPAYQAFASIANLGHSLWFDDVGKMPLAESIRILHSFLLDVVARRNFDRRPALKPYTASVMAERHAELFETVLSSEIAPKNWSATDAPASAR